MKYGFPLLAADATSLYTGNGERRQEVIGFHPLEPDDYAELLSNGGHGFEIVQQGGEGGYLFLVYDPGKRELRVLGLVLGEGTKINFIPPGLSLLERIRGGRRDISERITAFHFPGAFRLDYYDGPCLHSENFRKEMEELIGNESLLRELAIRFRLIPDSSSDQVNVRYIPEEILAQMSAYIQRRVAGRIVYIGGLLGSVIGVLRKSVSIKGGGLKIDLIKGLTSLLTEGSRLEKERQEMWSKIVISEMLRLTLGIGFTSPHIKVSYISEEKADSCP